MCSHRTLYIFFKDYIVEIFLMFTLAMTVMNYGLKHYEYILILKNRDAKKIY